jgi:hypothetical protein
LSVLPLDPATPVGLTRILAADFDENNITFQDETYTALLGLNGQSVRLAAAQAIDVMALNEVLVLKVIKMLDLNTDGSKVATAMKVQADELRRQEYEGSGDFSGFFDYTELVEDSFTARQRVISQWLRTGI